MIFPFEQEKLPSSNGYIAFVVAVYQTGIVNSIIPPMAGRDVAGVKVIYATLSASVAPTIVFVLDILATASYPGAKFISDMLLDISS